jgi:hypothetical protein
MTRQPPIDPVQRAGQNLWVLSGLSFDIVENTLDLSDLGPIVEGFQPEFASVQINRRVAGPMASGLYPEYALLAVFTAVASAFLHQLGKDAYLATRDALFAAYKKAKTWANQRGYHPFGMQVATKQDHAPDSTHPAIFFTFPPGLSRSDFDQALLTLIDSYDQVDPTGGEFFVELRYDPDSGSWQVSRKE